MYGNLPFDLCYQLLPHRFTRHWIWWRRVHGRRSERSYLRSGERPGGDVSVNMVCDCAWLLWEPSGAGSRHPALFFTHLETLVYLSSSAMLAGCSQVSLSGACSLACELVACLSSAQPPCSLPCVRAGTYSVYTPGVHVPTSIWYPSGTQSITSCSDSGILEYIPGVLEDLRFHHR